MRSGDRARRFGLACLLLIAIGACAPPEAIVSKAPDAETGLLPGASVAESRIAPLETIREAGVARPRPAPRPVVRPARRSQLVRGVYGRDSSGSGLDLIHEVGFNAVTVLPNRGDLDGLWRKRMKGLVWLWGYDTSSCSFAHPDDAIRREVAAIAGHPAILAYQIADEPNYARVQGCGDVPDQIKARSALVRSIDPSAPTYIVVSTWDGREGYPYRYFAGTTDVMGLDVYPYSREFSRPQMIDTAIGQAARAGVRRYWAVIQDFSDGYYVRPTAAQLREQFRRWGRSRMEGYFVYHWNAGEIESRPDHLAVYAAQAAG